MSNDSKKKERQRYYPYYSIGSTNKIFDVSRLENLPSELREVLPKIISHPTEHYLLSIPELAESIPAQIQETLSQIAKLKAQDPELGTEVEKSYLQALEDYYQDIQFDYPSLVLGVAVFLIATIITGTALEKADFSNATLEAMMTLLLVLAALTTTLFMLSKVLKRTITPQAYVTTPIESLHEQVARDLQIAQSGRVPLPFQQTLKRALTSEQPSPDEAERAIYSMTVENTDHDGMNIQFLLEDENNAAMRS